MAEEPRSEPHEDETPPARPAGDGDEGKDEDLIPEEDGGGRLGLLIVAVLVLALIVVAYLNKRSFSGGSAEPSASEAPQGTPASAEQPAPEPRRITVAEWLEQSLAAQHQLAAHQIFSLGGRRYYLAAPGTETEEGLRPGWAFDITHLADGVKPEHLYRRLVPAGNVFADTFPPLGLPDGPKGVYKPAAEADVDDAMPVIGVAFGGEARAYPANLLSYHEVINDTVGGVPVVIVWSMLADAPLALDRRVDGGARTFGSAGIVYQGAIVLYDVETRSLWTPVTGAGLSADAVGKALSPAPLQFVRWKAWKTLHPETQVLVGTDPVLEGIDYSKNFQLPAPDFYRSPVPAYPVEGFDLSGNPFQLKALVVGLNLGGAQKAYPFALLVERGRITDTLAGREVTLSIDKDTGVISASDEAGRPIPWQRMYWIVWKGHYPASEAYVPETPSGPPADGTAPTEGAAPPGTAPPAPPSAPGGAGTAPASE